ncbi:MAG: nicotinamide riboside transporter PnuC [Pirellulaceae bacterium]|nr:nicotinamide riboside transporter PnuC [Pirellulaceae bacterium]
MTPEAARGGRLDRVWLAFLVVAGGALSVYLAESIFAATVSISGILCVGLIAIGRREGYLIGLYNSLSYSILAYSNGLFGEVYLNLLFFVPTGVVGYLMWSSHTKHDRTVVMRQLGWMQRAAIAFVCAACTAGLGFLLGLDTRQNNPFIDATTNVLSVVATFLMMWRYKEQWLLYILLNIVSIGMWVMRYRSGGEAGDTMVLMWSLFLLNSLYGYWRWHMGAKIVGGVCFMGAPSTGKTTLARTMAERHNTAWMPEYGAEFWLEHQTNRRITRDQFEEIAPEHNRREDALRLQSRNYLFCDTNPMTTYLFAKDYHGTAGPVLTQLAMEAEKRYDLFFLCDTDIPYADTWDRSGDQKRKWFQQQILGDLAERRVPFLRISGALEDRVSQVNAVLRQHRKFGNVLDIR